MDDLHLKEIVEGVEGNFKQERVSEVAKKVRHVIQGMNEARLRLKKAQEAVEKETKRITDAELKIKQLKEGNWQVLNSIQVNDESKTQAQG